jgi:hypothetical protein
MVTLVDGEPGDWAVQPSDPGGQQAGLAGPGWRRQQHAATLIEALVQADK